jgi:hypothetical protein
LSILFSISSSTSKLDGTFRLDQSYCVGLRMTNDKFDSLFAGAARKAEEPLNQRHMDLAASIQAVTEEIVLRLSTGAVFEAKFMLPWSFVLGRSGGQEFRQGPWPMTLGWSFLQSVKSET